MKVISHVKSHRPKRCIRTPGVPTGRPCIFDRVVRKYLNCQYWPVDRRSCVPAGRVAFIATCTVLIGTEQVTINRRESERTRRLLFFLSKSGTSFILRPTTCLCARPRFVVTNDERREATTRKGMNVCACDENERERDKECTWVGA